MTGYFAPTTGNIALLWSAHTSANMDYPVAINLIFGDSGVNPFHPGDRRGGYPLRCLVR